MNEFDESDEEEKLPSAPNHPIITLSSESLLKWYIDQYDRASRILSANPSHDDDPDLCHGCGCCINPLDIRAHEIIRELEACWGRISKLLEWIPEPNRSSLRQIIVTYTKIPPKNKIIYDHIFHGFLKDNNGPKI